ncbi:MAG: 4,5-DOPA dioxygenase extradiol [Chloroflexi bacterium GWB2_49_20]|nr:MAG: 4,5-DOPA dioxygenase extradiol [Chloroflexi bacterium GWB2_49_20]OGN77184.1 MAG: 4,5-DOPA dioxygenase extradiol [Chloroflexi bacterium GWC2_49_37]OGN83910.1 MAG: 4,5-DOPA dioxygenase extradiol [Chloroflexi bacterium GWD2_49_16]
MQNTRMPVMFVGHGNPMNAFEDNEFSQAWTQVGASLLVPRAILCISAHWETIGTEVTAMPQPKTIHDFYGFPPELFALQYPAPGSPELAEDIRSTVKSIDIQPDQNWGLDHGTWSVLKRMFPQANIPVLQLSLDRTQSAQFHYDLGQELKPLRRQGVLIIGSGNIVHNLGLVVWKDIAFDWAQDYDARVKDWILQDDHEPIIHYETYGRPAHLAVNSAEHYEPLLYVLGLKEPGEPVQFFTEKIWGGSVSMRSVLIG